MTTAETRASNRVAIQNTVQAFSPGGDPRWLFAFAQRESNFAHAARAKSEADASGARKAWIRQRPKYEKHGNPHVDEFENNWLTSWGLLQLMAPYHVQRWSWKAHPAVLINPVINTVIGARLFNRAVQLGAENIVDVRQMWGTGSPNRVEPGWSKRKASVQKRFASLGLPSDAWDWPLERWGMQGFGLGEQSDQLGKYQGVAEVLGLNATPDLPTPPDWRIPAGTDPGGDVPDAGAIDTASLLAAVALAAGGAALLWGFRARRR